MSFSIHRHIRLVKAAFLRETAGEPVDNQNFRRWFGASKITDETGRPRVLYHGGRKGIRVFGGHYAETIEWANRTGFKLSPGELEAFSHPVFFFTDDDEVAAGYADQHEYDQQHTYEVYLKIENPLDLRPGVVGVEGAVRGVALLTGEEPDFSGLRPAEMNRIISGLVRMHHSQFSRRAAGHDGIIMPDTDVRDRGLHTSYVVFQPTQIKSVENDGSFDANDPDIHS